jgi:hypothetical protein
MMANQNRLAVHLPAMTWVTTAQSASRGKHHGVLEPGDGGRTGCGVSTRSTAFPTVIAPESTAYKLRRLKDANHLSSSMLSQQGKAVL